MDVSRHKLDDHLILNQHIWVRIPGGQPKLTAFISQNLIGPNGLAATTLSMLASDQSLSANIAEGNIISTPNNLARWLRQLARGEAGLDSVSVAEMMKPTSQSGTANYGLGIGYMPGLGYVILEPTRVICR